MELNKVQQAWCDENQWDFSDLRAFFINTTLNKSPDISHTDGLWQVGKTILQKNGVAIHKTGVKPRQHKQKSTGYSPPYRYKHSAVSRWCSDSHRRGSRNCWSCAGACIAPSEKNT